MFRSQYGDMWSITEQLLAVVANALHVANWQRAGKGTKPKPILPPQAKKESQTFGRDPIPISQFDDWWNAND